MRSLRVIVSLILLVFLFACMTEQYALLPRTEETNTTVNHCLVSLGFRNKSQSPCYQELINSDAALVAVWQRRRLILGTPPCPVRQHGSKPNQINCESDSFPVATQTTTQAPLSWFAHLEPACQRTPLVWRLSSAREDPLT
jgi:hypothetical protein